MDWKKLYFGKVGKNEVLEYVKDPNWQLIRLSMKGTTLQFKYDILCKYLEGRENDRAVQVRITNYVTALSRGGLIKPSDYLGE